MQNQPYHAQKRAEKIFDLYKNGFTLQEIGKKFKLTRERIRQIIEKEAFFRLAREKSFNMNNAVDREKLRPHVELLIKQLSQASRETRTESEENRILKFLAEKKQIGIRPEDFFSVHKFSQASGISSIQLKKYTPEIIEIISNNKRKRWSRYYTQCRNCGTSSVKHRSLGLCEECYPKSEEFREMQMDAYYRNYKRRNKYNKNYSKKYSQRENVRERMKSEYDLRNYGGNRAKAIERDGFRCAYCHLTREDNKLVYGKDLFVRHIDNNRKNNELSNLITLCYGCFEKIRKY